MATDTGNLTKRQAFILQLIDNFGRLQTSGIQDNVRDRFDKSSRITIIRDLNFLKRNKLIKKYGHGRAVYYMPNIPVFEKEFDLAGYFETPPDRRIIKKTTLEFKPSVAWQKILSEKELREVLAATEDYRKRFKSYSPARTKKELERLTIEFSWKSSHIEGNTYTLLDTERLIKEHREAPGKTREEATMILNHKAALDYIWRNSSRYKKISPWKIEEIHTLVSRNLGIKKGLRHRPVGIIGTAYKPYDNTYQVKEALEALCALANRLDAPFLKALVATAGISYIQPFEDGNKRSSRLLGNAVLLAYGYCPISYRSVEEIEYKKAIILFYEQHSLAYFKKLFLEQYLFAVKNYFS